MFVLLLLAIAGYFGYTTYIVPMEINENIAAISKQAAKDLAENPQAALSANPYTYTTNNSNYDNLVKLGPKAVPIIEESIMTSTNNGLREQILAIAAEDITKTNLKVAYGWATGKEWIIAWHKHLKTVPAEFDRIIKSNLTDADKNNSIVRLGVPALPYLVESIANGHNELVPSLEALLKDIPDIEYSGSPSQWAKDHTG
ncbi:MAG: hypothetical protein ACM3PP_09470, partial [Candidatus Saccharibacteria bacterium]